MFKFIFKAILIVLLIHYHGGAVLAECNVCQKNGAACVNQTSFQLCFGDTKPYAAQTFTCQDGLECTGELNICFQVGGSTPSCGLSKCGVCSVNNVFACTSRTTFAFCFGSTTPTTDAVGKCPAGYVCDYESNAICVPSNKATSIGCDIEAV